MKRYSQGIFQGGPAMFEQPDGKYVKHEDAAALREALGRLHAWALAQEGNCMFSGDHPIAQAAVALGVGGHSPDAKKMVPDGVRDTEELGKRTTSTEAASGREIPNADECAKQADASGPRGVSNAAANGGDARAVSGGCAQPIDGVTGGSDADQA